MKTYFMDSCPIFFFPTTAIQADPLVIGFGYQNFQHLKPCLIYRDQPFYTLHLILSGKGHLEYNNKSYDIEKDNVFLISPKTRFRYFPSKEDPWEYVYFEFYGASIEKYREVCGLPKENPVSVCLNTTNLYPLIKQLLSTASNFSTQYFSIKAQALLDLIFDSCIISPNKKVQTACHFKSILEIMQLHYSDPDFTINKLLNSVYISHTALCTLFKNNTGKTPIAYLNDLRMTSVETLLINSNESAQEISFRSGYANYYYFLTQFKKKHGMTTREYRALHKKHDDPSIE